MASCSKDPSKQEIFMGKLEILHKIRVRTDDMELLSSSLKEEATSLRQEEENMKEYKSELDLLLAEKLHHVEILRQIHSDINMMESVMKQGQEAILSAESRSVSLYKEYEPLKTELNSLRLEVGLDALSDDPELESLQVSTLAQRNPRSKSGKRHLSSSANGSGDRSSQSSSKRPHASSHQEKVNLMHDSKSSSLPPMKQCASCHQAIHRNAPICPLCKAKSRSRNPKKGKK